MTDIPSDNNIHQIRAGRFKLNGVFKVRHLVLKGGCDGCLADWDYCQMILKHPQAIPQLRTAKRLTKDIGDIAKGQIRNNTLQIACCTKGKNRLGIGKERLAFRNDIHDYIGIDESSHYKAFSSPSRHHG